jgi:hypothetical protein
MASLGAYRRDPSLATHAHPVEERSCSPQRRDDVRDESSMRRDFDTHPLATFELNRNDFARRYAARGSTGLAFQ